MIKFDHHAVNRRRSRSNKIVIPGATMFTNSSYTTLIYFRRRRRHFRQFGKQTWAAAAAK